MVEKDNQQIKCSLHGMEHCNLMAYMVFMKQGDQSHPCEMSTKPLYTCVSSLAEDPTLGGRLGLAWRVADKRACTIDNHHFCQLISVVVLDVPMTVVRPTLDLSHDPAD